MTDDFYNGENEEDEGGSFIDLREIFSLIVLNWYWIVLSLIFCLTCAKLYFRYTRPVYSASVKILIKNEKSSRKSSGTFGLEEMGVISNSNGFDNEMEILASTSISTRVVKKLKLYTSYIVEGKISDLELYNQTPIIVDMTEQDINNLRTTVTLKFIKTAKGVKMHGDVPMGNGSSGFDRLITGDNITVNTAVGTIMVQIKPQADIPSDRYLIARISPPEGVGRGFAARLSAVPSSRTTSVALLSVSETQPQRAIDFLKELVNSYNEDANEDKNEVARKTEEFIRNRIEDIRADLDSTEGNLEEFKKSHQMINLANDATTALSNREAYKKELIDMQTQMMLLQSLMEYCSKPENMMQLIPANMGFGNNTLSSQISKYNDLVLQRNRMLKNASETSPAIVKVTTELENIWPAIGYSLKSVYDEYEIKKQRIDEQYAISQEKIYYTPSQERTLNNIGRQQGIQASLYLMLLQKREENFISLASTAAKAKMIDSPICTGQIAPDTRKIWMMALAIGLIFPIAIIFLLNMLRYRIEGRSDVEKLTKLPILADIPLAKNIKEGERAVVVAENCNNTMEETFRGLRTNIKFVMSKDEKVIICTSCIPGEGKTFVSTNLAMSLALLGKKTIIIGLDIRKPRLVKLFGLSADKRGITAFLSAEQADFNLLEEQIHRGVLNSNLDVLPSGIIPPNPGELISRHLLDEAIDYLKERYDYVILDTPPVGLVSDTYELARLADMTIFVARAEFSLKANFELINNISKQKKLPKVNLVLNAIDLRKRKYGYYYGYGKYGKYGHYYGRYGKYSHYGVYGKYGEQTSSREHVEK